MVRKIKITLKVSFSHIFFLFILRFWFIILAILSACAIIYTAVILMMPTSREAVIKRRFRQGTKKEVQGLVRRIQVRQVICFI